jgi:DNA-directed RNA polymerase subunit omega
MIFPSEDLLAKKVGSRYTLVVLASKRAKQLRDGAPKLIDTPSTNPLTIALEEIAAGKIT